MNFNIDDFVHLAKKGLDEYQKSQEKPEVSRDGQRALMLTDKEMALLAEIIDLWSQNYVGVPARYREVVAKIVRASES